MINDEEFSVLTLAERRIWASSKALVNTHDSDQQTLLKTIATLRLQQRENTRMVARQNALLLEARIIGMKMEMEQR